MPLFTDKKSMVTQKKEFYIGTGDGRKQNIKELRKDGWKIEPDSSVHSSYAYFERKVISTMS